VRPGQRDQLALDDGERLLVEHRGAGVDAGGQGLHPRAPIGEILTLRLPIGALAGAGVLRGPVHLAGLEEAARHGVGDDGVVEARDPHRLPARHPVAHRPVGQTAAETLEAAPQHLESPRHPGRPARAFPRAHQSDLVARGHPGREEVADGGPRALGLGGGQVQLVEHDDEGAALPPRGWQVRGGAGPGRGRGGRGAPRRRGGRGRQRPIDSLEGRDLLRDVVLGHVEVRRPEAEDGGPILAGHDHVHGHDLGLAGERGGRFLLRGGRGGDEQPAPEDSDSHGHGHAMVHGPAALARADGARHEGLSPGPNAARGNAPETWARSRVPRRPGTRPHTTARGRRSSTCG
jgi:hypothetical protein